MPYTPTDWDDEVLSGQQLFNVLTPAGAAVSAIGDLQGCQIKLATSITTPGTELNAANLQKMEDAIDALYDLVEATPTDNTLVCFTILSNTEAWQVGDGKFYWTVPPQLDGAELTNAHVYCLTASSSGTPTVQIARGRRDTPTSAPTYNDMMSTAITIDENEFSSTNDASYDPDTAINTAYDDVNTGDVLRFDIDVAGTGTKGLEVSLVFTK